MKLYNVHVYTKDSSYLARLVQARNPMIALKRGIHSLEDLYGQLEVTAFNVIPL